MMTLLAYEDTGRKMRIYRVEKTEYLAVYISPSQDDAEYSRIMSEPEARAHYDALPVKIADFENKKENR